MSNWESSHSSDRLPEKRGVQAVCEAPQRAGWASRAIWQEEQTVVGFSGQEGCQAPHWVCAGQYRGVSYDKELWPFFLGWAPNARSKL